MAAASDVALVLDRDGHILDFAVGGGTDSLGDLGLQPNQRWADTVTADSRPKIDEMLADAESPRARWREVGQKTIEGSVPLRYLVLEFGDGARLLALGRDLRPVADLQQRLLHAQQAMEREYVRLRHAESRYRLLFQIATEAVLVVDPATSIVIETNPAAASMIGGAAGPIVGQPFLKLFHGDSRDAAGVLLKQAHKEGHGSAQQLLVDDLDGTFEATASMFRQESGAQLLVRLWPTRPAAVVSSKNSPATLIDVVRRVPEAFVLTDSDLNIVEVNDSFLELADVASHDAAINKSLRDLLGRSAGDLKVLIANLRDHGWVRNFSTVFNSLRGVREDVEVSGVSVATKEDGEHYFGLIIRSLRRPFAGQPVLDTDLPRSAAQFKDLVGRTTLREIVRETTDVIERLCIEAALSLTSNNRAMAAEMLGLSRQSLYAKLNRYGLAGNSDD